MSVVLVIDDPLVDGAALAERSERWAAMLERVAASGGGLVVVLSHRSGDDDLLAQPGALAEELGARFDRLRDDMRAACCGVLPQVEREPPHRPWLDQRRCRPRKRKAWRGKR